MLIAAVVGSGVYDRAIVGCSSGHGGLPLAGSERESMKNKKRVLILCTGNSARSQMAEGILSSAGGDKFEVESAGVAPSRVRTEAIEAMSEIGIDISGHRSKSVDEFLGRDFDYIITVCDNARESCPVFPGNAARIHWSFDDPAAVEGSEGERLSVFRRVRDEIRERLMQFVRDDKVASRT